MQNRTTELPMQMYHRIYRFATRGVPVRQIAATLNLPSKTVQKIIERFENAKRVSRNGPSSSKKIIKKDTSNDFLDVYILPKTQYTVIDIAGYCTKKYVEKLDSEFKKAIESDSKTLAILMKDVKSIDMDGLTCILNFHEEFASKGRFSAILSPSLAIEPFFEKYNIDEKILVFGTENAFENTAFKIGRDASGNVK